MCHFWSTAPCFCPQEVISVATSSEVATSEVAIDDLQTLTITPLGSFDLTHDSKIEVLSKHIDVQTGIVEMCKKLIVE